MQRYPAHRHLAWGASCWPPDPYTAFARYKVVERTDRYVKLEPSESMRFAETWEIVEYPGGPAPAEQTAFLNSLLERSP